MNTNPCTVPDCTGNTHGRSYCGRHRDQIAKGYLPDQAPSRLVDSHDTRDLLIELKKKHSMLQLGRLLGVSDRTVARAAAPANVKIERTLAESIRFLAGEDFAPAVSIEPITWSEVAAYALTEQGETFISKCRRAPKYRANGVAA